MGSGPRDGPGCRMPRGAWKVFARRRLNLSQRADLVPGFGSEMVGDVLGLENRRGEDGMGRAVEVIRWVKTRNPIRSRGVRRD
jgi:hypothetical protein